MKAKHVFLTVGLSLVMAGSVAAAGLLSMSKDLKPAKAAETTIYAKMEYSWWKADDAAVGIYCWGTGGTKAAWPGERMTAVTGETDMWSFDVDTAQYENVIFTRVNGSGTISDWGAKTKDLTFPTDGKNFFTITNDSATWGDPGCDGTWGIYPIPDTSYDVDVYVNGVLRGAETIVEGSLPTSPDVGYGKTWDGKWYLDSNYQTECTGVNSSSDLYCEVETLETINYSVDTSRVSGKFAEKYLYTWDDGGYKTAWPGDKLTTDSITVASDAKIIINAGDGNEQTVNITGSGIADDTIRVLNSTDGEGHYEYIWESSVDEPAEEGYYICSSVLGWTYSNAIQMLTESEYLAGNAACYFGYEAVAGEELRVRSYLNGVDSWYQSGDQNTDNYTFANAGTYDIYLNTGTPAMYYITDHVVRHNVTIKGVLYQGKDFDRVVTAGTLEAQEGTNFDRLVEDMPVVSGYSAYGGLFTDQALTTSYVPVEITSDDVVLYCRYIRNGVYVAGDEAFSGSSDTAWDILGAVYFTDECQDSNNAYEGVITIPASASSENPVACRPLSFSGSITWLSAYTVGTTYSFCSKVGDNIEFTEGGTYAVYVNQSYEVYFNIGVDAFYTKFLTEVQSVCNGVLNETKDITDLQSVWADQKAAYQALSATDQATIVAKTIDGGSETGSDLEKVIAKYSYIVHKYGTNVCEDFIWGQTYVAQSNGFNLINNNNAMIIIAVSISVVAISAVGLYFIIRRKRLVK